MQATDGFTARRKAVLHEKDTRFIFNNIRRDKALLCFPQPCVALSALDLIEIATGIGVIRWNLGGMSIVVMEVNMCDASAVVYDAASMLGSMVVVGDF